MKTLLTTFSIFCLMLTIAQSPKADHSIWNTLMKNNVAATGKVNYKNLKLKKNDIADYLRELNTHAPATDWTDN